MSRERASVAIAVLAAFTILVVTDHEQAGASLLVVALVVAALT